MFESCLSHLTLALWLLLAFTGFYWLLLAFSPEPPCPCPLGCGPKGATFALFLFTASAPRHFCSFLIFSLNYSKFKLKTKARDRPRGFNFQSTFACPCPLGCGPKGALFLNLPVKDLYR